MSEDRSLQELHKFLDIWDDHRDFVRNDLGGREFLAEIRFVASGKNLSAHSTVRIIMSGYKREGAIEIKEEGEISTDHAHVSYSPLYQEYRFDSRSRALVIAGSSGRFGRYETTISPAMD